MTIVVGLGQFDEDGNLIGEAHTQPTVIYHPFARNLEELLDNLNEQLKGDEDAERNRIPEAEADEEE